MSSIIVNILEDFLGKYHNHNEDKNQINFDCPACAADKGLINGDGKGNLEINYNKGVYKCWVCKDTNNMSGYIPSLIRRYGTIKQLKQYLILKPETKILTGDKEYVPVKVYLPDTFTTLSEKYIYDNNYVIALDYLKKRGITQDIIDYYQLGYTYSGKYFLRIIIPSYNQIGELNYFSGRAFSWVKPKYKNFDSDKQYMIFNEGKINWDSTIYLVEGPFDHIVTPNSIPLLGKYMYELLFQTIIEKAKGSIVIVLDEDAERDAENIYKQLFYSPVGNLVKIVKLPRGIDIAKIHEKFGKRGVIKILSKAKRLVRFKYN